MTLVDAILRTVNRRYLGNVRDGLSAPDREALSSLLGREINDRDVVHQGDFAGAPQIRMRPATVAEMRARLERAITE